MEEKLRRWRDVSGAGARLRPASSPHKRPSAERASFVDDGTADPLASPMMRVATPPSLARAFNGATPAVRQSRVAEGRSLIAPSVYGARSKAPSLQPALSPTRGGHVRRSLQGALDAAVEDEW